MESTNENEATEILNRLVEQYQTPLRRMCFIMPVSYTHLRAHET